MKDKGDIERARESRVWLARACLPRTQWLSERVVYAVLGACVVYTVARRLVCDLEYDATISGTARDTERDVLLREDR